MSAKSAVLAAAALGVVALGLYLFIQVRESPAPAEPTVRPASPGTRNDPPATSGTPAAADTPVRKVGGRGDEVAARKGPQLGTEVNGPPPVATPDEARPNIKLDNLMELANKHYDQQDFDAAIAIASKVLAKDPNNVRMLRIMVSANCIGGDTAVAQDHYERLPAPDREQMRTRCDRYGVVFKEPAK